MTSGWCTQYWENDLSSLGSKQLTRFGRVKNRKESEKKATTKESVEQE
jgi:hypothetical protein